LLDGRNVDEDVLAAIVTNDEAEAFLPIEEFDDALAFADDLRGHSAATRTAAAAAETTAAAAAAAKTITAAAAETVATATATAEAIAAAAAVWALEAPAAEIIFSETVALVSTAPAALSAPPSIKTHAV
jgi:hypothetical protein